MAHECPTCGDEFESFNGVSIHHGKVHDNDDIREMLIGEIRRVAEEVGEVPKIEDLETHSNLSRGPFMNGKRFGGWNGALEAAGFTPNVCFDISEEEAVAELQRAAEALGRRPTYDDLGDVIQYSDSVYTRLFGSWNGALEAAGLGTWEPPSGEEHAHWNGGPVSVKDVTARVKWSLPDLIGRDSAQGNVLTSGSENRMHTVARKTRLGAAVLSR
jgi:hypothetical protein